MHGIFKPCDYKITFFNTIFFVLGFVNKVHQNDITQIFYFGLCVIKVKWNWIGFFNIYLRSFEIGIQS
jgi:hypothetical protein